MKNEKLKVNFLIQFSILWIEDLMPTSENNISKCAYQ